MKFLGKFKRSALTLAVLNAGVACTVPAFAAEEEIEKIKEIKNDDAIDKNKFGSSSTPDCLSKIVHA